MGEDGAEGSSAIGIRRQAAVSLTPVPDGTHVHIFESSQLEVRGLTVSCSEHSI